MVNGSQGFAMMRPGHLLLPGVDLHVYGNPVHMLPMEDFLSLCILVRLSTIVKKNKIKIALYNMRFAMKY
jgi:hypothetical protein